VACCSLLPGRGFLRGGSSPGASGWLPQGGCKPGAPVYIHQSIRDDGWTLFGFASAPRAVICSACWLPSVLLARRWAAGPLFGRLPPRSWSAIVQADLCRRSPRPRRGQTHAERLSVELPASCSGGLREPAPRSGWRHQTLLGSSAAAPPTARAQKHPRDVQITLAALGYDPLEIKPGACGRGASSRGLEPTGGRRLLKGESGWLAQQGRPEGQAVA